MAAELWEIRDFIAGAPAFTELPATVLDAEPRHRWAELDLAAERTIDARLEDRRG